MPPSHSKRTVIIGDVHGCRDELMNLLDAAEVTPADDLVSVGDLICKGNDRRGVMKWTMETPNLRCVLGNHEARFMKRWLLNQRPDRDTPDEETYLQLGDCYEESMRFIQSWPLFLEGEGFFVVHAGIDPRIPSLEGQRRDDLLTIRIPSGMSIPWYEAYTDDRLAVFGHWSRREPVIRQNAIGLDTGCVYGGSLSALILPERRVISVPASRNYQSKDSWS